jgi:signal transduction histidine kinase
MRSGARRQLPALTIRGRLALVYGGLFLVAGILLLGVTYVLVSHQLGAGNPVSVVSGTAAAPPAALTSGETGQREIEAQRARVVQVATDTRDEALHTLLTQRAIALVVVGVAASALGWLVAGRMLQPLQRVTDTARRIAYAPAADRGLHERIALAGPNDEVKELADTFDVMLERLDHSFDGQRRFIANASHELRTPLTLNRTLLEVALEPPDASPEVRQLGTTLLAINERHGRLIDGLLLLARSERDVLERSYVDLADLVEHVVEQVGAVPVTVHAVPGEAPVTGNPVLLERLVQNLVENGVRHNVPVDGWVRVTTGTWPDGRVALEVTNSGPLVPRYEVPGLFEPFRRLREERVGATFGAGLGLSIVRAVAQAHGGGVHAEPHEGGGLKVTVTLPGAAFAYGVD